MKLIAAIAIFAVVAIAVDATSVEEALKKSGFTMEQAQDALKSYVQAGKGDAGIRAAFRTVHNMKRTLKQSDGTCPSLLELFGSNDTSICDSSSSSFLGSVTFCPGNAGQAPAALSDPATCGWYSDSSCCNDANTQAIQDSIDASQAGADLVGINIAASCLDALHLQSCAVCSPDDFAGRQPCQEFCNYANDACASTFEAAAGFISSSSSSQTDPSSSCDELDTLSEDPDCFNAAGVAAPALVAVAVAVVAALL